MSNIVRRILLIISVIGLIATGSLWYISGQDLSGSKEKFLLKAYTTNEKDIQKMKSKAEAQGYETQLGKTKRITKQKDGYRVVF